MKFAVVLVLCLGATVLASPLEANLRSRRQTNTTTCSNSPGGLVGLLQEVGYLVTNLLDNLDLRALLTGNHGVLHLVSDLLVQVLRILEDLLSPDVSSDHDANQKQGLVPNLLTNIQDLLNDLLGDNAGRNMTCNPSTGSNGNILEPILTAVNLNVLNISLTSNNGLVSQLLRIVIQLLKDLILLLI